MVVNLRNGIVFREKKDGQTWDFIELPNGGRIIYVECENESSPIHHSYWRVRDHWKRSTRLTGGSTLSKPYNFDPERLLRWKERLTCEGIAGLYQEHWADLTWLQDGDSILAKLKEHEVTADDVRDRKADVGTRAHGVLEALAAGESPEAQDGYGQAVINWWRERKPEVFNSEAFIYNAELGYAGRFDIRAFLHEAEGPGLDPDFNNKLVLADAKTSGWLSPSLHVQAELYELGAMACGIGPSDARMLLQLREDGSFREVRVRATAEDARACVAVYRGAGRIERESGLPRAA